MLANIAVISAKLFNWALNNFLAIVVAIATIVLVRITHRYTNLTHSLVRLQIDPNLESGFEGEYEEMPKLVLHNAGGDVIIDIHVNTQMYIFRYLMSGPISIESMSKRIVQQTDQHSWWHVARLTPDELQKKDIAETIKHYGNNLKGMERMIMNGVFHDSDGKPVKPDKVDLWGFVVFDIQYRREVDRKLYRMLKTGSLITNKTTGTFNIHDTEILKHMGFGVKDALDQIKERTQA